MLTDNKSMSFHEETPSVVLENLMKCGTIVRAVSGASFGDARAATNLQEAQKYFANSYLLGISPSPSPPPKPQGPLVLARSPKQTPTPLAAQLLLAIKPLLARASPTLCPHSFRGEAGKIPTKTVQITTGRGCANLSFFCGRDKDQKSSQHRVPPIQDKQIGPT